jgi:hypothetical protein
LKLAPGQKQGGFKYNPDEGTYHLKDGFSLPTDIYSNLFAHQKEGIKWLYGLY